ncbi:unnamed protein product [Musa acuminata subsp. malaccensis]|uniref:(wild Malaysian banana) hypothetical protein n=1 Tax=Musa acuminata subsp. malaccensis TaxID=214687 RepID=A0A8D7B5B6_MUSAM|nr:unnamed protein product [Musa acuminata subsp. malaccensis]
MIAKTGELCALLLLAVPRGLRVGADRTNHRYEEGDRVPLPLKAKRLEELAAEIKKRKEGSKKKQITDEDTKGKKVLDSNDEIGAEGSSVLPRGDMESGVSSQENQDELLAASLAAEEEMEINKNVLTSEGGLDEAEDDNDENEEMIFPMDNIHIDPAVLASLPPSMQLDLLVQMRESIMAENRQKYQKIKKDSHKQAGIVYNGGLVPLLKLLDSKNRCLQHNAAFALYGIAENEDNVSDFIKVGGVQKLQDGEFIIQATKDRVAKTMKRLEEKINGPVLKHLLYLMRVGEKVVQRRIALALAHLCLPEDQRTIFIDDDGTVYLGEQYVNSSTLLDGTFLVEGCKFFYMVIALFASLDAFCAMFDGVYRAFFSLLRSSHQAISGGTTIKTVESTFTEAATDTVTGDSFVGRKRNREESSTLSISK